MTTLTSPPTAPSTSDPGTFDSRADALIAWLSTHVTEVNAVLPTIEQAATSAPAAVAAAAYKGPWSSQTGALAIPATVTHSGALWMLTASVADVTAHTPGVSASWLLIQTVPIFFHLQDQKTSGTNAQTLSTTTWTKRDLATTVTNTITGASVASSVITLPAGRYQISAQAAGVYASSASGHQRLRLRNTSDGATVLAGPNVSVIGASVLNTTPTLQLQGVFTLAASKNLELQHYVSTTGGPAGAAMSSGEVEVYADVLIQSAPT